MTYTVLSGMLNLTYSLNRTSSECDRYVIEWIVTAACICTALAAIHLWSQSTHWRYTNSFFNGTKNMQVR